MKEKIKHAAVKSEKGMIFLGKCHADCFFQMKNVGVKASQKSEDQGFLTSKGRYVNREDAANIARKAKQLDMKSQRKISYLLSEDIWYQVDRFIYTPMTGYVEIQNDL